MNVFGLIYILTYMKVKNITKMLFNQEIALPLLLWYLTYIYIYIINVYIITIIYI